MRIFSPLLLTLLIGAGVTKPVPSDDSDLGYYFDDVPSEPILSKRAPWGGYSRGPPAFFRGFANPFANGGSGGGQTQAAAAAAPAATNQGGSRSVFPGFNAPTNPAAAASNGPTGVSVTTAYSTVLSGTATQTLLPDNSSGAEPTGNGPAPPHSKLRARQMSGGWWQHRGLFWKSYADHGFSASSGPQWMSGGYKKAPQGQSQGSGSGPPSSQAAPKAQAPPQSQAPPQNQAPAPQANTPQSAPAPAAAPAAAPSSNSGSSSGSNSGYMPTVNKWRSALGVPALTQDSKLEGNALKTANDGNGQMKHELNPGSMAQVLAPGNSGNFESVYVGGWLCEEPNLPGLNGICTSMSQGWDHSNGETGHADILKSTGYHNIGCALAKGIWACDLA